MLCSFSRGVCDRPQTLMRTPCLFSRADIFSVLDHQKEALKQEVSRLDSSVLEQSSQQEITRDLATKYKLEIPLLEEDKAYVSHREVDLDVSQDPMRLILDRSRPFYIKGVEITFHVPFRGDPAFFQIRPSSFNLNPPVGDIQGNEIHFVCARTDNNATAAKSQYEESVRSVKQYLSWLQNSVEEFNSHVGQQIEALVQKRRQDLNASAEMVAHLGLPAKATSEKEKSKTTRGGDPLNRSIRSARKWDVFICHASEDKNDFARPLAEALREAGVSVWFDEFSLKLGDSLRASIDYGLANSRYGITVLSPHFFAKHWPAQELNGLASCEVNGTKVILPVWHNVGFEEVRQFSPTLADRVAANSREGMQYVLSQIVTALDQQ
jgi:hypothetical protein